MGCCLPSRGLTPEQAIYQFISGYTAKVAGTKGRRARPAAHLLHLFGAPFMVHHPCVYAELLRRRDEEHGSTCWLVNTGWTRRRLRKGKRINIKYTRAMVEAALSGKLDDVEYHIDPVFGLHVPLAVPGVPADVLDPRSTWSEGSGYDEQALKLARLFHENFQKYADGTSETIRQRRPQRRRGGIDGPRARRSPARERGLLPGLLKLKYRHLLRCPSISLTAAAGRPPHSLDFGRLASNGI